MTVPEFDSPEKEYTRREIRGWSWFELTTQLACWLGIAGLILLISQGGRAETNPGRSGFLPGARPFNPFTNAPPGAGGGGKGNYYYDDEDDDDTDGREDPSARSSAPKSYSAGGNASSGVTPIITDKGISVGG